MRKTLFLLVPLLLGLTIFMACEKEDDSTSTVIQMNELTKEYSKSLENLIIDFRESNNSVFSRGIELDLSNLKEARTKDELVSLVNDAKLKINPVYMEDVFSSLERIKTASKQSDFDQEEFENLLTENMFRSSLLRGTKIECLQAYDDSMSVAAVMTGACGAIVGPLTMGEGLPACMGYFLEELARAELTLYYCIQRVNNER